MSKAESYRQYASLCLNLARNVKNPDDKAMLLHMAETWRQLAERLEKRIDSADEQEP
jgi:hypothetical protein